MAISKQIKTNIFNWYMEGYEPGQIQRKLKGLNARKIPVYLTIRSWIEKEGWDKKREKLGKEIKKEIVKIEQINDEDYKKFLFSKVDQLQLLALLRKIVKSKIDKDTKTSILPEKWKDILDTLHFTSQEQRLILQEPTEIVKGEGFERKLDKLDADQLKILLKKLIEEERNGDERGKS